MDHLCELPNDAARRKALNTLPATLHATYERILQRISRSNKDIQQLVQRSLRWLVCSREHLTSQALCEAISVETGDTRFDPTRISDEKEILRWCSSLVRRSVLGDGLELAHFTVKDFLTTGINQHDREFGVYHIDLENNEAELAERCLTYLFFEECRSERIIAEKFPIQSQKGCSLHEYAIRYWADHARKNLSKGVVLSLTQDLLHPSKEHIFFWAQNYRLIVYGRSDRGTEDADPRTANPPHFTSMLSLSECCEWLLQKGCHINQPSAFGTPLECALAGHRALAGQASLRIAMRPLPTDIAESRLLTVKLLIDNGANVHRSALGQPSPLFIALRMADKVSCIELLRKGALIDSNAIEELSFSDRDDLAREIWEGTDATSLRPEDRATLLDAALGSERFSQDELITDLANRSQDLASVFLSAAKYGQLGVVEQILQDHAFNINVVDGAQNSALHLAAFNDHVDIVKILLEHGANCTLIDHLGRTPLHASVEKPGGCRCLKMLLGYKVDLSLRNKDGLTVWHVATERGNLDALRIFWDFTEHDQLQLHLKAFDGRSLLHCAAQSSSKDTLTFLMDHCNQSLIHLTTSEGFTALHYAVKADSLEAVQYLIDRDLDIHAMTNDGSNALHCAVDKDSKSVYEIVKLLLKRGLDPGKPRKDGMTPINILISAASQKFYIPHVSNELEAILHVLIVHATTLRMTYGAGLSILHQVCQLREDNFSLDWRPNALKILLQNGADPKMQDSKGRTALMYLVEACKREFLESGLVYASSLSVIMIQEFLNSANDEQFLSSACTDPEILCLALISRNETLAYKALGYCSSVDETVKGVSGLSCLKAACMNGCSRQLLEELLRRSEVEPGIARSQSELLICACTASGLRYHTTVIDLLDLGFDPNHHMVDGTSALMMAAQNGHLASVEVLIDHGADLYAINKYGWSVVHHALLSGRQELWHALLRRISDWNATIEANLLGIWSRDVTAIQLAASLNSNALDFLLQNGLVFDINHATEPLGTALCIAVRNRILRNVDLLLEADVDTTLSCRGAPPLHIAACFGYLEIVKVFAKRGVNLTTQDRDGLTPELVARKQGYLDVAKFLKEKTSTGHGNKPHSKNHVCVTEY